MTYQVLARTYRPQTFDDVVGQEHITRTLTRSFENDRLGHAYIFSGPRGIGKTTTARLLAKLVNCEDPDGNEPCNQCESCEEIRESRSVDVMEIDGASNNSVDQIRDLRENVQYAPANNRKKVYVIDEVHMLSKSAFNALLKTLEEPPEHVMFIFATTEIENVPDTILSRCQRYDFKLIPLRKLVESLEEICEKEDIPVEDEALFLIARFAEGSLRDAQSILDQMINFTGAGEETLTGERVSETWGLAPYDELLSYVEAIRAQEPQSAVDRLHQHVSDGHDLTSLIADLAEMIRNLTLLNTDKQSDYLENTLPGNVLDQLRSLSDQFTRTELHWTFDQFIELHEQIRQNSRFQLQLAEVGLIRIIEGRPKYNLSEITDRLEALETDGTTAGTSRDNTQPAEHTSGAEPTPDSSEPDQENTDSTSSPRIESPSNDPDPSTGPAASDKSEAPDTPSDETADQEQLTPTNGQSDVEPTTADQSDDDNRIDRIISSTAQPAQAYLRESTELEINDGQLIVRFVPKWANHAESLKKQEHLNRLKEAIAEVMDDPLEPVIEITEGEEIDDTDPSAEQQPANESNETTEETDEQRLLDQTKEVFDVKEVREIEDS